jgi:hypothetical protein
LRLGRGRARGREQAATIAAVAAATALTAVVAAAAASVVAGKGVRWWAATNAVLVIVEAFRVELVRRQLRIRSSNRSKNLRSLAAGATHDEVPSHELCEEWRG